VFDFAAMMQAMQQPQSQPQQPGAAANPFAAMMQAMQQGQQGGGMNPFAAMMNPGGAGGFGGFGAPSPGMSGFHDSHLFFFSPFFFSPCCLMFADASVLCVLFAPSSSTRCFVSRSDSAAPGYGVYGRGSQHPCADRHGGGCCGRRQLTFEWYLIIFMRTNCVYFSGGLD
jgi:hypothetical protein